MKPEHRTTRHSSRRQLQRRLSHKFPERSMIERTVPINPIHPVLLTLPLLEHSVEEPLAAVWLSFLVVVEGLLVGRMKPRAKAIDD